MNASVVNRSVLAMVVVMGLAAGACGREAERETGISGDPALAPAEGTPLTLIGCLQESGGDFVLTVQNIPAGSASPRSDQMKAAQRSYRLNGDDNILETHLGRQIQVTATLEEPSDLPTRATETDVDTGDIAEVSVTSIERVADSCGDGGVVSSPSPGNP